MAYGEWTFHGTERLKCFEKKLTPEHMANELNMYQDYFGEDFGVRELLYLLDIRSKAMIAEAINDMPEFFMDQAGKMRNSGGVDTITGSLEAIASAISEGNYE